MINLSKKELHFYNAYKQSIKHYHIRILKCKMKHLSGLMYSTNIQRTHNLIAFEIIIGNLKFSDRFFEHYHILETSKLIINFDENYDFIVYPKSKVMSVSTLHSLLYKLIQKISLANKNNSLKQRKQDCIPPKRFRK